MIEKMNNISFKYDEKTLNIPINKPWNLYYGDPVSQPDYRMNVVKTIEDPPFFIFHLTERCNLNCRYCFEGDKGIYDMSKDTINQFEEYIKLNDIKRFAVRFFGGEPTLKVDLIEYIINDFKRVFPKENGYKITYNMFTNAVNINDKLFKLIGENHIGCFISLDGCKLMHDKNRIFNNGKGSYDIVLKNAQKLQKEIGAKVVIRSVYDIGIDDVTLISLVDECYKNGFDMVSIEIPWVSNDSNLALNQKKLERFKLLIREYTDECLKRLYNNDFSLVSLHEIFKHTSRFLFKQQKLEPFSCLVGKATMAIAVNGDLYPCHSFVGNKNFKLGNIKEGITNKQLKSTFENYSSETQEGCCECPIKYYCSKRCLADSLWFNNDLNKINPLRCEIEKEFFKAGAYIYSEIMNNEELLIKTRLYIWQFKEYDEYR